MVGRRRRFAGWMVRAVRVEPRMELETTLVGLGDSELERIVPRIWRPTHSPGEILGPRLIWRGVQRVGRRPDLQNHRVQMEPRSPIEDSEQFVLLFLRRQAR